MTAQERLRQARQARKFASAASAARAMGVKVATYCHHENGTREFNASAAKYARFFRVSIDWLLTGRGKLADGARAIPINGFVGAGALVEWLERANDSAVSGEIALPAFEQMAGLTVIGDSLYPRFLDGETVLYDPEPVRPNELVDQYCIVQTLDGRRLIKRLRRGRSDSRWRLECHKAPPEDDVELMGAWRYLGTLPAR